MIAFPRLPKRGKNIEIDYSSEERELYDICRHSFSHCIRNNLAANSLLLLLMLLKVIQNNLKLKYENRFVMLIIVEMHHQSL